MHDILHPFLGFKIFAKHYYLACQMIKRNILLRYKGSVLGIAWSFANPMLMLAVYSIVFTYIFKARVTDSTVPYAIFMFAGMSTYNIFRETVSNSCSIIYSNSPYVKKIIFPLEIFPMIQSITCLIFGLIWYILLFIGLLLFTNKIYFTVIYLPLILIPLVLFSTGLAFITSSVSVFLRDLVQVVNVVLQALFFMTPICYSLQALPPKAQNLLKINPMALIVEETRSILLYGNSPSWTNLGIMFCVSLLVFHLGLCWFRFVKKGFANAM